MKTATNWSSQWLAITGLVMAAAQAEDRTIQFLSKVRSVEVGKAQSSVVGDGGRARGLYQFHSAAWTDVSSRRRILGQPIVSFRQGAHDEYWSALYAIDHTHWLEENIHKKFGWCSEQMLYAAWNAGLSRVLNSKGRLENLPAITQRGCRKFSAVRYYP